MKKILSSFLAATLLLFSSPLWAPINPIGIDTTTGQQKVNTSASIQDSGSGTFVDTGSVQSISGAKTFADTKLLLGGAGAGVATVTYANSATSRTVTVPDPGAAGIFITDAGAQNITGVKSIASGGRIDGAAIADAIVLTSGTPTISKSIAQVNRRLDYFDTNASAVLNVVPIQFGQQGLWNICFIQGADSSILKITSCQAGAALGSTNPGYVRVRSSTAGTYRTFLVTADVTLDLTGFLGYIVDASGDVTGAIARVYAIDDNSTLVWGIASQAGFFYIRNTQDTQTASSATVAETFYTTANVATDNSPVRDVGWIKYNWTDSSNEVALTEFHPNESADGIWMPWNPVFTGFSVAPTGHTARFTQWGQTSFIEYIRNGTGTSNATAFTITSGPIKAKTAISQPTTDLVNNGAQLAGVARVDTTASSRTYTLFTDSLGSLWAAANGKNATFFLQYENIQP